MKCPYCNEEIGIKKRIINLLKNPQTATELKKHFPHISSTGTIPYHLNQLMKDGIIIKETQKHIRGKPVIFSLNKKTSIILNIKNGEILIEN